jgi:hypothetical protein
MPVGYSCSPEMKYKRTSSVGTSVVEVLVVAGDVLTVLAAAMVVVVLEVLVVGSVSSSPSPGVMPSAPPLSFTPHAATRPTNASRIRTRRITGRPRRRSP